VDVKTLCLGVLTFGEMSGYEIKQYFEDALSHFFLAGFGSIYPGLADLTRDGLVSCSSVAQDKRPDKKVYRITDKGRQVLLDQLMATPPRHKVRSEFMALLWFAHMLPEERLQQVFDERESDLKAQLELVKCAESEPELSVGQQFVIGMGRAALEAQLDYLLRHRERGGAKRRPVQLTSESSA
jgi:PadR family transcriptional regulator AphA